MAEPADESVPSVALSVALPVVALGGALGAVGRYGLAERAGSTAGTLIVNLLGCLLLGVLVGARPRHALLRLGLGTGVLGGFTTMSTFAVDTLALTGWQSLGYLAISVGGCLGLARAGLRLGGAA